MQKEGLSMMDNILTIQEVLQKTRLSRTGLYAEINRGGLVAVKVGRRTFVRSSDLDSWFKTLKPKVGTSVGTEQPDIRG